MKQKILFLPAIVAILASVQFVCAQRLYDPTRDAEAQKAAALAAEITSKGSFEKQLRNLEVTEKHNVEVYLTGARRQMEIKIRTFRTWGAVAKFADQVQGTLDSEDFIPDADAKSIAADVQRKCPERITKLGMEICAAKSNLAELQQAVADSEQRGKELDEELKSRLEKIDAIESLVDNAQTLLKDKIADEDTIKGLSEVFLKLAASTVTFTNKLSQINKETSDELRLLLQRIAVEALQLEVDHWKTVGEIKLRRAAEQKEIQKLVTDLKDRLTQISNCFAVGPAKLAEQRVTDSVANARTLTKCSILEQGKPVDFQTEQIIAYLYKALHVATALASRGETPAALAELRLSHEERRFSIRHSAIIARSYEVALSSGTKRLARFYAGGIKPEKIAQLVYAAATVAIPGVIAGQ